MTASVSAAPTQRLILVPSTARADRGDATVRRFRLARLRLEGREVARAERFAPVRRSYD